jgi:hypothetical protein
VDEHQQNTTKEVQMNTNKAQPKGIDVHQQNKTSYEHGRNKASYEHQKGH